MKTFFKKGRAVIIITVIASITGGIRAYAAADMPYTSAVSSAIRIFVGSSDYNITDKEGNDINVFEIGGEVYAPIRAIAEALGKDMTWDVDSNKIVLDDTFKTGEFFSFEEYKTTKFPLIASIPEKNIQLYGIKPRGVVLYKDGSGYLYDWDYLTPRGILPKITSQDFNNDGKEEIGVSLYWGSGTGISIEQLHVLEMSEDKYGDSYYIDYEFLEADYLAQLKKILQYEYNSESKTLVLRLQNKSYGFACGDNFEELHYQSIVNFEFENSRIKAIFPLGIKYKNSFVFEYTIGALITEVSYSNGVFTLTEPELDEKYDSF